MVSSSASEILRGFILNHQLFSDSNVYFVEQFLFICVFGAYNHEYLSKTSYIVYKIFDIKMGLFS